MPDVTGVARSEGAFECKYADGGCSREAVEICATCHEPFCKVHASELDPAYCSDCLNESKANFVREPLKDDEGVVHEGTHIIPQGPAFKTLAQRVVEMTDEQLRAHIEYWKNRAKWLENALEYARISLASSELELAEREESLRRKLRGVKVKASGGIAIVGGGSTRAALQDKTGKLNVLAGVLKSLGLTEKEQIDKFIAGLKAHQAAQQVKK